MRIFHLHSGGVQELGALPTQAPAQGFVWIACTRTALQAQLPAVQNALQALADRADLPLLSHNLPADYAALRKLMMDKA